MYYTQLKEDKLSLTKAKISVNTKYKNMQRNIIELKMLNKILYDENKN